MDRLISGAKEKVEIEEQLSQCLLLDVKGKSRGKRLCGGCWKEVQRLGGEESGWQASGWVVDELVLGWVVVGCGFRCWYF
ncbi:hypothetical protein NC651_029418 [Populus alba x Populus x berolinensis]|nr:hypothetical protein NC651_029418 [Populus alba x Populus x berolinensis]